MSLIPHRKFYPAYAGRPPLPNPVTVLNSLVSRGKAEMQVLREKDQVYMHSIIHVDLDLKPPGGDVNLLCSDGKIIASRFF